MWKGEIHEHELASWGPGWNEKTRRHPIPWIRSDPLVGDSRKECRPASRGRSALGATPACYPAIPPSLRSLSCLRIVRCQSPPPDSRRAASHVRIRGLGLAQIQFWNSHEEISNAVHVCKEWKWKSLVSPLLHWFVEVEVTILKYISSLRFPKSSVRRKEANTCVLARLFWAV